MFLKTRMAETAAETAAKSAKTAVETLKHPTKRGVKGVLGMLLCGLAVFAFIKMLPELRRYARIKRM